MKRINVLLGVFLLIFAFSEVSAQVTTGVDLYSSYIWRGSKFGSGPAVQPYVDYTTGGLSVGAWGSVCVSEDEAFEMDLYLGYSFDFGLSLTVTDYYFGGAWTDFAYNHYIEPMVGFEIGSLSLTGAVMLLPAVDAVAAEDATDDVVDLTTGIITYGSEAVEAVEAAGFGAGMDMYFEAAYSFGSFDLTLGAGNGQYTRTEDDEIGKFNVCNISLGTSKEIPITEKFSLPVSGSVMLNPATGGFFIAVGISL